VDIRVPLSGKARARQLVGALSRERKRRFGQDFAEAFAQGIWPEAQTIVIRRDGHEFRVRVEVVR